SLGSAGELDTDIVLAERLQFLSPANAAKLVGGQRRSESNAARVVQRARFESPSGRRSLMPALPSPPVKYALTPDSP
ncbi:MAG TPA: hypothetical protein VKB36_02985, partial [Vicinamibacterales bacterium]|nr:hypothetical protein [Vicinamibacterales bacterium]